MTLNEWMAALSDELGLDNEQLGPDDMHTVLDLARDVAHLVQRPAAPLTAYLVGLAVGRGGTLSAVGAKATALAQGLEAGKDPDQN